MKSEGWFKEECFQYAQTAEMLVDFVQRIYTEGRRDQVKACDESVKDYEYKHREDLREGCYTHEETFDAVSTAIRAAGPREGK